MRTIKMLTNLTHPNCRRYGIFLLLVSASILWGCTRTVPAAPSETAAPAHPTITEKGLLPDTHLPTDTVLAVFNVAGEYRRPEGNDESIEIRCTLTEGRYCWFSDEDLGGALYGKISRELSFQIIGEINANVVEQAKNSVLKVRCIKPVDSTGPIACEGNWGWSQEWDPIQVR